MDFKNLQRRAKQLIDRRGGTDSVKADAEELKDIAKGPGSVTDKAKRAGDALRDPGAKGPDTPASPRAPATETPVPTADRRPRPRRTPKRPGRRSPAIRPAPSCRSDDALLLSAWKSSQPIRRGVGWARTAFFASEEQRATAHWPFRPLRAEAAGRRPAKAS